MYKAKLTEKEAKNLGEKRWMVKNQWRHFGWIFGTGAALIGFCCLGVVFDFPDWANVPGVVILGGLALFFLIRGMSLCTKAGKEFVKSLVEEK